MALPTNVSSMRCKIKQRNSSSRFSVECGLLSIIYNMSKNAFYFFALDWAKEQKKRGISVPRNMKELSSLCSEDWKNLPPHEKGIYKSKAKDNKIKAQMTVGNRTTIGESVAELELEQKRQEEFQQNMLQYIESIVGVGVRHDNLKNLKFIFIHVNWFYRRDIGINKYDFCPAEFAIAEFSILNGIRNVYHEILKVKIPLGWKRDALETSQETHQIPIELDDGEYDFALMYDKFSKFMERNKTGRRYPPLFTLKNAYPIVESLLQRLNEASGQSVDDYLIYSIEALFGELRNAAVRKIDKRGIPLVLAETEFAKDYLSTMRGFECEFHKIVDVAQYCSRSIITRWGMTICDYCCEYLNVEMIEGVHRPYKNSFDINRQDTASGRTDNIDLKMKTLKILENRVTIADMNGVSKEYRDKVSTRSYEEEKNRRMENKVVIVDHAKASTSKSNTAALNLPMRPLRAPKTMAKALSGTQEGFELLNDVTNFPPIGGRGTVKKDTTKFKLPLGRGRGNC
ncbi:protein maelstrom isoform X1 [Bombus impatiens]|uniref:Protein maelstrom isoform X1 n=2 Tax=Bombus impatiens TaxID=132113 RepID=A0A6P3DUF1_BOMIM|nr:protein maelstrom isoform X1 [Bombus impatiens]